MAYHHDDDEIDDGIDDGPGFRLGSSILRVALLFSSAGIAFALILAPIADRLLRDDSFGLHGIDRMSTGSIDPSRSYTVRKSVLQEKGATCIIRADGRRSSGC
jgi:hypothetical protein